MIGESNRCKVEGLDGQRGVSSQGHEIHSKFIQIHTHACMHAHTHLCYKYVSYTGIARPILQSAVEGSQNFQVEMEDTGGRDRQG